ncbi:restriction endonuclease subunit S [Pueribacillus sp. YX66]|uniref:restriction endonuclease subunit S n=1 Tax=Pueribacillus sp. YX66 TaxID=3229242 RepID=UPI0036D3F036
MAKEMKDSGVEWIGEIPSHWQIAPLHRLFFISAGGDAKHEFYQLEKDENHPYPVYTNTKDEFKVYSYTSKPVFPKNSITVSGRGEIGRAFFRNEPFDAIIRLLVLVPKLHCSPEYYTYFINDVLVFNTDSSAVGQLSTLQISPYRVAVPPLDEQQKIVDLLSEKVGKINNIIKENKKSILELKDYKQSIITEVVTKGLDPNAEMKDSVIEWMGKVPIDWNVRKIGNFFNQVKDKNTDMQEKNLLSLSYGSIIKRDINTSDGLLPANFSGYNIVRFGDIVLRMTDLQNDKTSLRTGFVTEKGIITSAYITIRTSHTDIINPKYIQLLLHSFDIYKGFYGMGSGVRQNVTFNDIKKLPIILPSKSIQDEIVKYVEKKATNIDNLVNEKEKIIDELEKYKKSLIYEYVTGKKEV